MAVSVYWPVYDRICGIILQLVKRSPSNVIGLCVKTSRKVQYEKKEELGVSLWHMVYLEYLSDISLVAEYTPWHSAISYQI